MFELDEEEINYHRENSQKYRVIDSEVELILNNAEIGNEIDMESISKLLSIDPSKDKRLYQELLDTADRVRDKCLGNYVNIVAPLYISNFCVEQCEYCGYSVLNKTGLKRHRLSEDQLKEELKYLINDKNYQSIELVFADDPKFGVDRIAKYVDIAKNYYSEGKQAWLVGVNSQPFDIKDYRILKDHGADIVLSWQETYHQDTYNSVHKSIKLKGSYEYRLQTQDRVYEGKIKETGVGVLFGLYDYTFEVLSLIKHARHLRNQYRKDPLIGIPRIKRSNNYKVSADPLVYPSDKKLKQLVAIIRLSVPYSHIFVSTREKKDLITSLLKTGGGGVISALCSVSPGGYVTNKNSQPQFDVNSYEPIDMMHRLREIDFIPSYSAPVFEQFKIEDLTKSIIEGEVVVFVGAGFSNVANKEKLPLGKDLMTSLEEKLSENNVDYEQPSTLPHIAQLYENKFGRDKLEDEVKHHTNYRGETDLHKILADIIPIKEFISINYDSYLEDTLNIRRGGINLVETDEDMLSSEFKTTVYKIHGSHSEGGNPLVITSSDFNRYSEKNEIVYNKLKEIFFTKKVLFLGCSIQDTNISELITTVDSLSGRLLRNRMNRIRYYAVARSSIKVREILKNNELYVFNTDIKYFVNLLIDRLRLDYVKDEVTYSKLWDVRTMLEVSAAASAAQNRNAEDIASLKNALDLFQAELGKKVVSNDVLWKYDYKFHLAISKASKNIIFYDISKTIYKALKPISSKVQSFETLGQHKRIFDAICKGDDVLAKKMMKEHIDSVKEKSRN